MQEINKIRAVAREVYDNMNENKRKYQEYLEANEELECETAEAHKVNNELKLSVVSQISENDNVQSEVRYLKHDIYIYNLRTRVRVFVVDRIGRMKMFAGDGGAKNS